MGSNWMYKERFDEEMYVDVKRFDEERHDGRADDRRMKKTR